MSPQPLSSSTFSLRSGIILGCIAVAVIAGYAFYALLPYLSGPSLSAHEATENGVTTVTGRTERVSYLSVNGAPVPLSEDGSFSVKRAYPPGYTAVTLSAKDRFGREITRTLTFLNT